MSQEAICKPTQTNPIQLTPAAILHLQKQIQKRGSGIGMRLSLKKSGCSGYAYTPEIIDTPVQSDKSFVIADNLVISIPEQDFLFLYGMIIDYVKEGLNAGFKYMNPNEKHSCGCGESVGF